MNRLLYALLAALYVLFYTRPAFAQEAQACGPRAQVLAVLLSRYHERPIAFDITPASPGGQGPRLLEVLMAPDGSTGSIMTTDASGRSCLLSGLLGVGKPG
jgi:hypothetical protein